MGRDKAPTEKICVTNSEKYLEGHLIRIISENINMIMYTAGCIRKSLKKWQHIDFKLSIIIHFSIK